MSKVGNIKTGDEAAKPATPATVPNALGIVHVEDAKGRRYGLRKLKPSERYTLSEKIEAATMSANMQLITVATVISIGEEGLPPITSKLQLLNRLDQIGDDGLQAITPAVLKMYGIDLDKEAIEAAKN